MKHAEEPAKGDSSNNAAAAAAASPEPVATKVEEAKPQAVVKPQAAVSEVIHLDPIDLCYAACFAAFR